MKTLLFLLLIILTGPSLMAEDPFAQTADPFASNARPQAKKSETERQDLKMVEITLEWIQMKEADATSLLHSETLPTDTLEWRKTLLNLVRTGTGKVAASTFIVTKEYQQATTESVYEHHYVSGYETDKKTPQAAPIPSLEMRQVGIRVEVMPLVENDGSISIQTNPEWTVYVGDAPSPVDRQPQFYVMRHLTNVKVQNGGSMLLGMTCPPDEDAQPDPTQRILCFVSARILKP